MATAGINVDTILDVVNNTLKEHKKEKWIDISLNLQEYHFMPRLLSGRYTENIEGSYAVQWQLQHRNLGTYSDIQAFSQTPISDRSVSLTASVPWRTGNVNFAIDEIEVEANGGMGQLVDLTIQKKHACFNDMAVAKESQFWGCPLEANTTTMWGIFTWIVPYAVADAATAALADDTCFIGGLPYGGTVGSGTTWTNAPHGVSPTTYPNEQNYAFKYTSVSFDDLIEKMSNACDYTNFKAPNAYPALVKTDGSEMDKELYVPKPVINGARRLARSQNSVITNGDLAEYDNKVKFRGRMMSWVPQLDSDTRQPVIGVDWRSFKVRIHPRRNMRQTGPMKAGPEAHTVVQTHYDLTAQPVCYSKRNQFVGTILSKEGS